MTDSVAARQLMHMRDLHNSTRSLQTDEDRFQLVARATIDAVWEWNFVTKELWWNEGVTTLFGYARDEAGCDLTWWKEHLHPHDRERVLSGIDSVFDRRADSWSDEYRFLRADDTYAYVFDRGYIIYDGNGKPVRAVGVMVDISERKRSEEALRETQHQLQAILANSPSVIFLKDTSGRYLDCNPPFEKLCGRSRDQIIGRTDWQLLSHEAAARCASSDQETLRMGVPIEYEESLHYPDGLHTSIVSKFPLRDREGRIYAIGGIVTDITARKHAEEALVARNQELQTIHDIGQTVLDTSDGQEALDRILAKIVELRSFDIGIVHLLDSTSGILKPVSFYGFQDRSNAKAKNLRTDHPDSGLTLIDMMSRDRAIVAEELSEISGLRAFKREGVRSAIIVLLRAADQVLGTIQFGSRTPRKFDPAEVRLLETFGNQLGVAIQKSSLYEATQRNLNRLRALHEINIATTSTLNLNTVLELLLEKITLLVPVSCAATVKLLNRNGQLEPAACRNLDPQEWLDAGKETGGVLTEIVLASKTPVVIQNLLRDPRTGHLDVVRKNSFASYFGTALVAKGRILGRLAVYTRDEHEFSYDEIEVLTTIAGQASVAIQNAQMYEEIVNANKVKDEFLSVISHELRTPLNIIMGYSAMMEQKLFGKINAKQQSALSTIIAQSSHLTEMINNVLYVTTLDAGLSQADPGQVDLGNLLAELRSERYVMADKKVSLIWDYADDLPVIETDSFKLKTILHNIISNAISFTDEGAVTVSARQSPERDSITFEVIDTGVGITTEALPMVFQKFWQLDTSESRVHEGLGIGLYIAKGFAELLRGSIQIHSELGKGSCFKVTIPAKVPAGARKSGQL